MQFKVLAGCTPTALAKCEPRVAATLGRVMSHLLNSEGVPIEMRTLSVFLVVVSAVPRVEATLGLH